MVSFNNNPNHRQLILLINALLGLSLSLAAAGFTCQFNVVDNIRIISRACCTISEEIQCLQEAKRAKIDAGERQRCYPHEDFAISANSHYSPQISHV